MTGFFLFFALALNLLLLSQSVRAQSSLTLPSATSSVKIEPAAKITSPDETIFSLKIQNSQYVSSGQTYFRDGAESNNRSLDLRIDTEKHFSALRTRLKLRDEYSATEKWNYLNVNDAHMAWQPNRSSSLAVGRRLDRWNEWEDEWRQGLFQPRYLQNKWRNEPAGLTGLFWTQKDSGLALTAGFLPVHLPDFGAHSSIEDDHFASRNPWFSAPATQFIFRQVTGDIRYSVDSPDATKILNHPGGVAKIEINSVKNYFGRFSAAYKPVPQLLLGFPSRNRVFVTAQEDYMSVRITPRVAYHAILSHDSVVKRGAWTASASVVREVPDEDGEDSSFTAARIAPSWITALSLSRPLEEEGPNAARVRFGFLKINGGDAPDQGDFAGPRTLFERRFQFNEAYLMALNKPWRGFGLFPLDSELRLIFDRVQNGGVASLSLGHNFTKSLRGELEVDFLGLLQGSAKVEDGFLALYRANDRVGLGISYVY